MAKYMNRCQCCQDDFMTTCHNDKLCPECKEYFKSIIFGHEQILENEMAIREKQTKELLTLITERDALKERVKVMEGALENVINRHASKFCTNIDAAVGCDYRKMTCHSPECHKRIFDKLIAEAEKEGKCE